MITLTHTGLCEPDIDHSQVHVFFHFDGATLADIEANFFRRQFSSEIEKLVKIRIPEASIGDIILESGSIRVWAAIVLIATAGTNFLEHYKDRREGLLLLIDDIKKAAPIFEDIVMKSVSMRGISLGVDTAPSTEQLQRRRTRTA